jgi:hypothetical protein
LSTRSIISRRFCGLALLSAVAGCDRTQPAPNAEPTSETAWSGDYTPSAERDSLLAALRVHRRRWHAARLTTYQAKVSIDCFCPPQSLVLLVHEDSLIALHDSAGHRLPAPPSFMQYSVDSLFRLAEKAIQDSGQKVMVRYDSQLGYPREIHTDSRLPITDVWLRIRMDGVRPVALPRTAVAPPT